ncbi:MAG: Sulfate and thiosulfate import ATP-binding protein CysA [Ktedonobacterales bacterium]|nr:MAG: Sulfate and thiosulfate import ATP-binding protein CysA [Ktedonobacterales bacterium]
MSIVLEHLTKRYDGRPVVNNISLEVADGDFFVLLGPSGSGKSTVLRMIAGLTGIESGKVSLHGRDVTYLPPQERSIGFVFQQYALFQHMSIAENIEFGLRVRGMPAAERRRRREELLDLVGLAGLGNRLPRQLSGGQQQRVALARALAPRPAVLLLDEPFGALDAKIRVDMRRNLRAIQRELGITTIFVTHDQEEAFELGDQLGVMNVGRLLEAGPPTELYLRPQTEFAATFLGSANLLVGETTPTGVQVGPLHFPLSGDARQTHDTRRVQVLFRPEDIALTASAEALADPPLGQAVVEESAFAGSYERLRLRLPPLPGVRAIAPAAPFGSDYLPLDAVRSQEQSRRFPLRPGDVAWVGVHRMHALAHPGLSLLLVTDGAADQATLTFGGQLAQLAHARVTVLGAGLTQAQLQAGLESVKAHLAHLPALETRASADTPAIATVREVERQPYDIVAIPGGAENTMELVERALESGEHHVLIVPRDGAPMPTRALICVAGGEPSKDDVLFAGRLARHLGAQATLLSVLADEANGDATTDRTQRFLDAGARTLALLGVSAETAMRAGALREVIEAEMDKGRYDLLVLGAPLYPIASSKIRAFVSGAATYPVLIVRSPYAAAATERAASIESRSLVEERF